MCPSQGALCTSCVQRNKVPGHRISPVSVIHSCYMSNHISPEGESFSWSFQVGFLLTLMGDHITDLVISRAGLYITCHDILGHTVFFHRAHLKWSRHTCCTCGHTRTDTHAKPCPRRHCTIRKTPARGSDLCYSLLSLDQQCWELDECRCGFQHSRSDLICTVLLNIFVKGFH